MKKNDAPIIVKQTFNNSIENVWKSITEIDQMRQWYFDNIPAFKPQVGFETQFSVQSKERNFLHMWKVTEVIPMKKISYNWTYNSYPGDSFVEFELFENNNLTELKLTVHITENFPQDIPEFSRESCVEGWKYFIKNRLKEYLENIN